MKWRQANLSGIELKKKMFIRIFKELSDSYKELTGNYNSMEKEIETINKNQEEMKNTICGINYARRNYKQAG